VKLRTRDEAKFVITDKIDLDYTINTIKNYEIRSNVIIQPVLLFQEDNDSYFKRIKWLIGKTEGLNHKNLRILPQFHQLLWRDEKGK
jgi:hypothetical protein